MGVCALARVARSTTRPARWRCKVWARSTSTHSHSDRFGQLLAAGIHEAGVTLSRPDPIALPTSLAVVGLDGDGKASYSFYRDGVADRQVNAEQLELDCERHNGLRIVATGCLALVADDQPKYLPWLRSQRHAGRFVVVDANLRPAIVADMAAYQASVRAALGRGPSRSR